MSVYDKDKLWGLNLSNAKIGYIDTADDSETDVFVANPDLVGGGAVRVGINDGGDTIISWNKDTPIELMSVLADGTYLLATSYPSGWTPVTIEKPDDNYAVSVINTADNVTLVFDHSVRTTLWDGTWKFYYPQTGDYTQVKIKVGIS
ncbi:hypothetical protein LCGC14_2765850 [marine sediment metagenome]|uniref:Uncharacterized protein n=1 Tax=marine sediment metagenome TaxID=412755 RepID=A0A0F8YXK0_9ZZZZ